MKLGNLRKRIGLILVFLLAFTMVFTFNSITADASDNGIKMVSAGKDFTLVLEQNNTLWGFGSNSFSQLGNNFSVSCSKPIQIMKDVKYMDAGEDFVLVIKTDNTLWGFGHNTYGQLGDISGISISTPQKIMDDVKLVSAGQNFSLAVKNDGTLWAFGKNDRGQLGNNTSINSSKPIKIMSDVVSASAGLNFSLAIKTDNTLWAWGDNSSGQLGDGKTISIRAPKQIMDDVRLAVAGLDNSFAIKTDNTLWAWGGNYYGQLGDGSTIISKVPKQVLEDIQFVSTESGSSDSKQSEGEEKIIKKGGRFAFALKTDGTLLAWGNNPFGQLGNGKNMNSLVPLEVLKDVKTMAAGGNHGVAVKSDNTLWTWGLNTIYQLGTGSRSNSFSPNKIQLGQQQVQQPTQTQPQAPKEIGVIYNGGRLLFLQPPIIESGTTLAHAATIYKAMGAEVTWDQETQIVTAVLGDTTVQITIGSSTAMVNGQAVELKVPAKIINGNTMIPVRFIGESFGATVYWDAASYSVMMFKN